MCDSDEAIFLTQNTFRDSSESETEAELASKYLLSLGDRTLDEHAMPANPVYQPEFSDVSEDELISTCERLERGGKNPRFPAPVSDVDVQAKSQKRYVALLIVNIKHQ